MTISKLFWRFSQSINECTSSPWCAAESLFTVDGNLSVSCENILQQMQSCFKTNTFILFCDLDILFYIIFGANSLPEILVFEFRLLK